MFSQLFHQLQLFAVTCANDGSFFGLPTWYKYLKAGGAGPTTGGSGACTFEFIFPDSLPLVALALLEIALRVAGIIAIFYVVYGGIQYVVSEGEPDKISKAKGTIINALIGVLIATFAVAIVSFIGMRVTQ